MRISSLLIICGIDEAGRGSFVGPLAIAGVCIHEEDIHILQDAGVRDSKRLSPYARQRLYNTILDVSTSHTIRRIYPRTIDNSVVFHGLTDLEMKRMADIIRNTYADIYYVDSCYQDAGLFGKRLSKMSGNRCIKSYTKADSLYTVVAAASILAKVARDRSISHIRRHHPVGNGYPGDTKTSAYVRDIYASTGEFPRFARKSWYTACRIAGDERLRV